MAEPAGPSTQDGIYYQNSVAARYLAELVDLQRTPPREAVVEVRVEAPTHVDDIVVRYADGHRDWIQAKVNLRPLGRPWTGLWVAFSSQVRDPSFSIDDRLVIAMGKRNDLAEQLQALIERASSCEDADELAGRLGGRLRKTYQAIQNALPKDVSPFRLLRLIELRVQTLTDIETWFGRLDLGSVSTVPNTLLSNLRDLAGGAARVRGTFRAAPLRRRLAENFGIDLFEPREWGLGAYRGTLLRSARIEVPGKGVSTPVQNVVIWPRVRRHSLAPDQDFDNETPRWDVPLRSSDVDLSRFPQAPLTRCILIAGPGMGKSTLITALVAGLANSPIVPVEVPLGTFVTSAQGVIEFLESEINRDFSVRVDWQRLADQGLLCVFFDGLDEVPTFERGTLLKKIALFSARFPDVPWLLTVRDPAALNGPLDGELLELEPFDNREIASLVNKYKVWSPDLDEWTFIQNLEAYPDLARLARIPLFLSIMLARWSPNAPVPRKRSEVIDGYLDTLFDPDRHKGHPAPRLSGSEVQAVAQALAFSSLDREEIGLSRRQAMQVIPLHADGPADAVLNQLVAGGVLRASKDGRFRFPYPIVQEYLAAVHLVDAAADQIPLRLGDVVKRPWAQVLQFALELLPDATPHIQAMLAARDDVFSTGLRLIGRCIANGAVVSSELRDEIGRRLAMVWGTAHYDIRERVGRLIVDAYSKPIHPEVRKRLSWRWLLGSGAGEIIRHAADPALTAAVVDELLARKLDNFMNLRDLQSALQAIASEVAVKVAVRARIPGTTGDEFDGLSDFLDAISVAGDDAGPLVQLADDVDLPIQIRLAARSAIADPPDEAFLAIAKEALENDDWKVQSAALKVFAKCSDTVETIGSVLTDPTVSVRAKSYLIERMDRIFDGAMVRGETARTILQRPGLSEWHSDILRIYRLRAGDGQAMLEMIDKLDRLPSRMAQAVLVSLNHFPEDAIGIRALEKVQARNDVPSDAPEIAGAVLVGLTHKIVQDGWNYYGLEEAPPHPSLDRWSPMFDRWLATTELTKIERLRMLSQFVKHRPELIGEIKNIVFSATDPDAPEWDEDKEGHQLRHGLDALRALQVDVPFDLAQAFAMAKRPNLPYAGLDIFRARATKEALSRLLALYKTIDADHRSYALSAIEVVASRLNVTITEENLSRGSW